MNRTPDVLSTRCVPFRAALVFLFAAALGGTPSVQAQRTEERTYKASFTGLTSTTAEKYVIAAFTAQDPAMLLSIDMDLQQAKVRTAVLLDEQAIHDELAQRGIGLTLSLLWNHPSGDVRSVNMPGFPLFINTGDPLTDQADYEARKQAWIATHPAEYEELLQRTTP